MSLLYSASFNELGLSNERSRSQFQNKQQDFSNAAYSKIPLIGRKVQKGKKGHVETIL